VELQVSGEKTAGFWDCCGEIALGEHSALTPDNRGASQVVRGETGLLFCRRALALVLQIDFKALLVLLSREVCG
jgi:hypothetical protein